MCGTVDKITKITYQLTCEKKGYIHDGDIYSHIGYQSSILLYS